MFPLNICKRFLGNETLCFIVKAPNDLYQNWYDVLKAPNDLYQNWYDVRKDDFGDWYPGSTAGLFNGLDEAVAAMKKHRPMVEEVEL